MINSKADYEYYLKCDEIHRGKGEKLGILEKFKLGKLWKYNVILRKCEYYLNCRKDFFGIMLSQIYKYRLNRIGLQLGWTVLPNTFGPGLCIVHAGTVVVNGNATVGSNCRIQSCVNIGSSGGGKEAPQIGDNVYIGPGAKIFGNIILGSNLAIGANSVVNKSFTEDGITIAGVPAKKISDKGSDKLIIHEKIEMHPNNEKHMTTYTL